MIDASALLEILLRTERADRLMERAFNAARAELALQDLADLVVERHEHQTLIRRIWQLRDSLSAYDGAYLALAEALAAPLLTCDGKLAGAHGHRATIELVRSSPS